MTSFETFILTPLQAVLFLVLLLVFVPTLWRGLAPVPCSEKNPWLGSANNLAQSAGQPDWEFALQKAVFAVRNYNNRVSYWFICEVPDSRLLGPVRFFIALFPGIPKVVMHAWTHSLECWFHKGGTLDCRCVPKRMDDCPWNQDPEKTEL